MSETTDAVCRRTSGRAKFALATLVAGYVAMAITAGARDSPLTVLLPEGASPPAWARAVADAAHLNGVGRRGLTGVAWALLVVVVGAFAVAIVEAWANRVRLRAVLAAGTCSVLAAVAAPLLLSRDVYTYAAYGRIESLHGGNPYLTTLSAYPHDRFVAVASVQWLHTTSHYGPLFTLLSAWIARMSAASVDGTILAFKVLAGASIVAAAALVAFAAQKIRPERAALAAALVALNPVIVVHTVGGGHVDALIAVPLAGACALLATRPQRKPADAFAITVLLTLACLIKAVMLPVLLLWLVWLVRRRGIRTLGLHVLAAVALGAAAAAPFVSASRPWAPFASLGGIEYWASPSHFLARGANTAAVALAGAHHPGAIRIVVQAGFLLLYGVLLWRLIRRTGNDDADTLIGQWGIALFLLALSLPYLLPWYAAWFVPFLVFFDDSVLTLAGVLACLVLAFTLVPADPFHGLTTPAVMDGVHYGAAPLLLVILLVVGVRMQRPTRGDPGRQARSVRGPAALFANGSRG